MIVEERWRLAKNKIIREAEFKTIRQVYQIRQIIDNNAGFKFDKEKLPFYDIPDLTGFDLKPYVQYNAPKLSAELSKHQFTINNDKIAKLQSSK